MRGAHQRIELTSISVPARAIPAATGITFGCLICFFACVGAAGRRGISDEQFDDAALLPRARRPGGRRARGKSAASSNCSSEIPRRPAAPTHAKKQIKQPNVIPVAAGIARAGTEMEVSSMRWCAPRMGTADGYGTHARNQPSIHHRIHVRLGDSCGEEAPNTLLHFLPRSAE